MPITFEIDTEARIVRATARGDITLEEELACFESFLSDPRFESGFGILHDNRERRSVSSTDYVKGMADAVQKNRAALGPAKVAIVVSRMVSLGLSNMFAILTENALIRTRVFWDIEEAERWLAED
jgi:hypothetical protein